MSQTKEIVVKPTAEEKEAAFLVEREAEILKKYKRAVANTIQREPKDSHHAGKLTVVINCATEGCENQRRVATSDLFQVKYCESCVKERRLARKRKKSKKDRKEKSDAKKAEALVNGTTTAPKTKKNKKAGKKEPSKKGPSKKLRPVKVIDTGAGIDADNVVDTGAVDNSVDYGYDEPVNTNNDTSDGVQAQETVAAE